MFGLGTWEIILILVVALIFIGPDKLPQVARSIGKGMRQVRSAMSQVDTQVRRAADDFVNAQDAEPDPAPHAPPVAPAANDDDHQILRAPPGPPPTAPSAGADAASAATSEDAPTSSSPDEAPAAAAPSAPPAPRDWHAHVGRPVEGRVAAARPGRRPSSVIEDAGEDATTDLGGAAAKRDEETT